MQYYATHFEDLNPNQQAIPSLSTVQLLLGIDVEQGFEGLEPDRKNRGGCFVHGVGELIFDHIQSGNTLAEY